MNGRSHSESSSITLDNFALLKRFTCTCCAMFSLVFSFPESLDSGFDSMNLPIVV